MNDTNRTAAAHDGRSGGIARQNPTVTYGQEQLSDSAAQVLAKLISGAQLSRPELTSLLNVTAPTVTSALAELLQFGLVTQAGSRQGQLGRAARLYALDPGSGWLLGVDLGSTQFHLVARTLDGTLVSEFQHHVTSNESELPQAQSLTNLARRRIKKVMAKLSPRHGKLRAVGVALPHVVPNDTSLHSKIGLGEEAVALGDVLSSLGLPPDIPVLLENNVNCAALAEMSLGAARSAPNYVYMQIGVRLGAGLVIDGKLRRGSAGGGGELARIPFPIGPTGGRDAHEFLLEKYLGSAQFLSRVRKRWHGEDELPPDSTEQLFALASRGYPQARAEVREYAADIAQIATILCAVVDPGLIVLGGGVGQNQVLGQLVEELLRLECPGVALRVSTLGQRATVEGAVTLASDYARTQLLREHYPTVLSTHGRVVAA